jgi:hypothetical protein
LGGRSSTTARRIRRDDAVAAAAQDEHRRGEVPADGEARPGELEAGVGGKGGAATADGCDANEWMRCDANEWIKQRRNKKRGKRRREKVKEKEITRKKEIEKKKKRALWSFHPHIYVTRRNCLSNVFIK